jgi:hypothetical protein
VGIDAAIVATWMAEVTAERNRADLALATTTPADAPTVAELRGLIEELGDMVAVLTNADPKQ